MIFVERWEQFLKLYPQITIKELLYIIKIITPM